MDSIFFYGLTVLLFYGFLQLSTILIFFTKKKLYIKKESLYLSVFIELI